MMARGPGWILGEGEVGEWHVRVTARANLASTLAHLHRSLRELIATHGGRPLRIDLEQAPRL
ncbi:MAG: hypothetical protein KC457_32620, partial [Myxococcales bacterium]|nr:hypothetical protein [Myxococcales bacterium]